MKTYIISELQNYGYDGGQSSGDRIKVDMFYDNGNYKVELTKSDGKTFEIISTKSTDEAVLALSVVEKTLGTLGFGKGIRYLDSINFDHKHVDKPILVRDYVDDFKNRHEKTNLDLVA